MTKIEGRPRTHRDFIKYFTSTSLTYLLTSLEAFFLGHPQLLSASLKYFTSASISLTYLFSQDSGGSAFDKILPAAREDRR